MHQANHTSDQQQHSLRIAIDSKAKGKIGNRARGGKERTRAPKKADDHDTHLQAIMVPFGRLDVVGNPLTIFCGQSHETSDFIVDCFERWWYEHAPWYPAVDALAMH